MSAAAAPFGVDRAAPRGARLGIWFVPPPEGLTVPAWRLFAIFASAIFSVIIGAFPIFTASVLAVAATVMTACCRRPRPTRGSRTRPSCSSSSRSSWPAPS